MLQGERRTSRTGTDTLSVFGVSAAYDLRAGFPILTTKRIFWRGVAGELLWFLSGSTDVKPLQEQGIHIWDAWADENGQLGPIYGHQWMHWNNQLERVIAEIRTNPTSRRLLVSAWNVDELDSMVIFPVSNADRHCRRATLRFSSMWRMTT